MTSRRRRKIIIVTVSSIAAFFIFFGLLIQQILGPFGSFFWNIPSMTGFLGSREYLILLQNNSELRPTGGFITAVGDLRMFFGVPSLTFMDSYEVPDPKPKLPAPEPFSYFIGNRDPFFAGWTFRDANFSPDTAQSAKAVIERYTAAFPEKKIDGVFFLDFSVLEELLGRYGPIMAEGVTFDRDHFFLQSQRLSKDIDTHNATELKGRKNVFKPFADELKSRMLRAVLSYRSLLKLFADLAKKKHLQAFFSDRRLQEEAEALALSTTIAPPPVGTDLLVVNIANIGGRKADRYMRKSLSYRVDFTNPEKKQAEVTLELEHLGTYNLQSDIYQAYVRVYTLPGTTLISSSGSSLRDTKAEHELGLNVYSDILRLSPGENIRLKYLYRLPDTLSAQLYSLKVVKQPGVDDAHFSLAIQMPNDTSMLEKKAGGIEALQIRENVGFFEANLNHDLFFQVSKESDREAPIVVWQEFRSLSLINVRFQEELDKNEAENVSNYSITDLDQVVPGVADTIKVSRAKFEGRDLWLTVSGVTEQREERYQLTMRDLKDLSGNVINPNPLERTLVQRLNPAYRQAGLNPKP